MEESKDINHSGLTEDMDKLSIEGTNEDAYDKTSQTSEPTKTKKKGKKKGTAAQAITTAPPVTRSRLAAMKAALPKKQKDGVVYDDFMLLHRSHLQEHPERPGRPMAIYLILVQKDIYKQLVQVYSEECTREDLLLAHTQKHVATIMKAGWNKKLDIELKP